MRTIKFRIYNKDSEKIQNLRTLEDFTCHYVVSNIETLMQYTGLLDKNGVEIYEGDIVSQWDGGVRGEITFERYVTDNEANEDMLGWVLNTPERYHAFDPQTSKAYEIIGDIYQNPELLETKTTPK